MCNIDSNSCYSICKNYFFLVLLLFFSTSVFSQKATIAEKEIKKLLSETGKYLNSGQNDKSLTTAKTRVLIFLYIYIKLPAGYNVKVRVKKVDVAPVDSVLKPITVCPAVKV